MSAQVSAQSQNDVILPLVSGLLCIIILVVTKINVGRVGPVGLVGTSGYVGQIGATGAVGPVGLPNYTPGVTGFQGFQGPTGPTGAQGPQGPQGAQSPAGNTGDQGVQGLIGPVGVQGPFDTNQAYVYAVNVTPTMNLTNPGPWPSFADLQFELIANNVISMPPISSTVTSVTFTAADQGVYYILVVANYQSQYTTCQNVGLRIAFDGVETASYPAIFKTQASPASLAPPTLLPFYTLRAHAIASLPLNGISTTVSFQYSVESINPGDTQFDYGSFLIYRIQ